MSSRLELLRRLEGAQADAADPQAQVWLSASAGTGKTHVLTARVLRLLLNGAAPEAILCLTFTKAGAAEMAERIQGRLAAWVRMREADLRKELFALDEPNHDQAVRESRRLFARVLDAPGGGLRIQTIHSFCQTLLAGFPAEAGLTPGFRPLDGRGEAALQRETLARLLVEADRTGDLGLLDDVQKLSRRLGEDKAQRYLVLCARSPDALAALGPRSAIEARVRTALAVPLGDVEEAIAAACADDRFDVAGLRRIAAANRQWGTKTGTDHAGLVDRFLAADPAMRAAMLSELIGIARTRTGEPRSWSAKLVACDPAHPEECAALGETVASLLSLRSRAVLAGLLTSGLRSGQAYALAYAGAKRAAGAVDFDDLIRLTVDLLERPGIGEWIRFKLDARTDHVLVDEGQDTNTAQWRIVRTLADEYFAAAPGDGPVRTLFSVGDFKQAIFGFQGTDPVAFAAARAFFERAARDGDRHLSRLSLDRSFRSSPPVLAVVDRLIADLGATRLGLLDAAEPHRSARGHLPGVVTRWAPVAALDGEEGEEPGEEGWLDDATRRFAGKLAAQVRDWLAEPLWLAGKGRPLQPEDVLVLVRRRGALASLLVARLYEEGVRVAGVDRLRLDAPLAVRDLMAAIRFVLQPEDDLSLAALLVSPLFGLSQDELYAVGFGRQGSLWAALSRRDGEAGAIGDAVAPLRRLLARADYSTPYRFLEDILSGPLDGRRRLTERLGTEARDPIEELLNAALAFEGEVTASLQRFLDWFDRDAVEVTRDPSAPLDAVRVMTVHGAKGLQAPLVILADATGDPDATRGSAIRWSLDGELEPVPVFRPRKAELAGSLAEAAAAAEAKEREEHWRLLYVAATRAEERLVIGGALGPRAKGQPPAESWYAVLATALEGLGAVEHGDLRWGTAWTFTGPEVGGAARSRAPRRGGRIPAPLPAWARRSAPEEARPPRPLSPSAPGDDDSAAPPPGPALAAAARRGRLLHGLFERLPALPVAEREEAGNRWLERTGGMADPAARQALVSEVCRVAADAAFADLFHPDALAEAPVTALLPNGAVVAGTVDRLRITDREVLLVDFKTGARPPATIDDVPPAHLKQMAAYRAALAVIFPNRRVRPALLYTAGPRLFDLPDEFLDRHKPGLGGTQQKPGSVR
jgi:ATP-dependent helicase/nuclease subunit A